MTTRFKVEIEHLPDNVVVDVELWSSSVRTNRPSKTPEGAYIENSPGERKEDYRFTRIYRTLDFSGAGFNEYLYQGQAFVLRERNKHSKL
jgi:hypothetical protein